MFSVRSTLRRLLALVALCGLVVPAQAQMPLSGTVSGDGTLTPQSQFVFRQDFEVDGDDTLLGPFTGQSSALIDFSDLSHLVLSNGMFTETFQQGTLFGTVSGSGAVTSPGNGTFENDYVFTGGTGLFAGAAGTATTLGTFIRNSPTTFTATGSYVGSVAVPEPGAAALLAGFCFSGLGLAYRRLRRRR
jgi:hypothetical protein